MHGSVAGADARAATQHRSLAIALVALLSTASAARAGTLTVDRFDDVANAFACTGAPGDCSLRGAVIAAGAAPGADTIVLAAGTYSVTSPGPAPDQELDPVNGDIDVTSEVTIAGPGDATLVTISVEQQPAAFDVGSGGRVTIENLTIENGIVHGWVGSAIAVANVIALHSGFEVSSPGGGPPGGTLAVDASEVRGGDATGIRTAGTSVAIRDSLITANAGGACPSRTDRCSSNAASFPTTAREGSVPRSTPRSVTRRSPTTSSTRARSAPPPPGSRA